MGIATVLGGLLYSSYKSTHPDCQTEDLQIVVYGDISDVRVMDRNTLAIGTSDELIVVDVCKNAVTKRIKLVKRDD
jgi:hypothetical protein